MKNFLSKCVSSVIGVNSEVFIPSISSIRARLLLGSNVSQIPSRFTLPNGATYPSVIVLNESLSLEMK